MECKKKGKRTSASHVHGFSAWGHSIIENTEAYSKNYVQ